MKRDISIFLAFLIGCVIGNLTVFLVDDYLPDQWFEPLMQMQEDVADLVWSAFHD